MLLSRKPFADLQPQKRKQSQRHALKAVLSQSCSLALDSRSDLSRPDSQACTSGLPATRRLRVAWSSATAAGAVVATLTSHSIPSHLLPSPPSACHVRSATRLCTRDGGSAATTVPVAREARVAGPASPVLRNSWLPRQVSSRAFFLTSSRLSLPLSVSFASQSQEYSVRSRGGRVTEKDLRSYLTAGLAAMNRAALAVPVTCAGDG